MQIGPRCKIRRAILDKYVEVPEGTTIGYDPEADRARNCTVTDQGITIIAKMQ